jgi:hypothetical protein
MVFLIELTKLGHSRLLSGLGEKKEGGLIWKKKNKLYQEVADLHLR